MASQPLTAKRKFLWIGWDGADWEHIHPLLDAGLLPHLEGLINRGVMGNLATLQPMLSPMLWNSAATGKHAYKHGITGFIEPDRTHGGSRPFSSYSRRCKAIWNILSQEGFRCNVVNWWASHPAEPIRGCAVSNLIQGVQLEPGGPKIAPGTVHPAEKAGQFAQLKMFPEEVTAEQICAFIPRAGEIDQDADSRLQVFARTFAEMMTTHAVGTAVMEQEPWDFMAVYYTAIDHFAHAFMAYHPPRQPQIPERDFEIFKEVMTGAYRFSDMMLGRLLQLAGEETTILLCSDHGFESREQRPLFHPREPAGPAIWHRRFGIFVMAGPGIREDERVYGASLIDITPTILATLDLPIGEDMDGRPLLEIFQAPPEVQTLPSWEEVPGPAGMHAEEQPLPAEDAEALIDQFVALGYIDDPGQDKEAQYRSAEVESKYNLARNYLFAGLPDRAVELLEEISFADPWETRFITALVQAYQAAGYRDQAVRLIERAFDVETTPHLLMQLIWAELQWAGDGRDQRVEEILQQVENRNSRLPSLMNRLGVLYLRQSRWEDAERVYRKALEQEPESAEAWQGLSRVYCRQGRNQETVDAALAAVGLIHRLPHAHLNLGIALARAGDSDRAATAFQTALHFSPGFVPAHRWLATLYRGPLADPDRAAEHRRLARQFRQSRSGKQEDRAARKTMVRELCDYPSEAEREQILHEKRPLRKDPRRPSGKEFVIVSGLPRSGTSLMMQLLEAGGLPAKTDRERTADEDNPRGYYEWERIKKLKTEPEMFEQEEGLENQAIKIVSMLLPHLPYAHRYRVLFMTRPIEQVVASQQAMIARRGTAGSAPEELPQQLAQNRMAARHWLESHPRVDWLEIDYPTLVSSPEEVIPLIAEFLGPERLAHPERMADVIDPDLYRQQG